MYQNGMIRLDDVVKVTDTLVDARLSWPDKTVPKNLEALAGREDVLALSAGGETMSVAFAAAGYRSTEGFALMDVWAPVYCLGAMADTVVTLKAHEPLHAAVRAPRHIPDDPRVHVAHQQFAGLGARPRALDVVEDPLDLGPGEVGGKR